MDLFSLYVLFSHFTLRDVTPGNTFFQMSSSARAYVCIIYVKQKENSPRNITWSEMGKQNVQAKEVHYHPKLYYPTQTTHGQKMYHLYPFLKDFPLIRRFRIFHIFRVLEYSVYSAFQNIQYFPCFRIFHVFRILEYSVYAAIPPFSSIYNGGGSVAQWLGRLP